MRYHHRHTSIKALLLILPIGAIVAASFLFVAREPKPAIAAVLAVLAFVAIVIAVFSILTVEVTDRELRVRLRARRHAAAHSADRHRAHRIILPW